jgi:hypothetical protein
MACKVSVVQMFCQGPRGFAPWVGRHYIGARSRLRTPIRESMPRSAAPPPDLAVLRARARVIRRHIVEMLHEAASGHPGGSLSAVEIVRALYFGGFLRYDPARPNWPDRDRFEAYDIEAAARRISTAATPERRHSC